jgi:hypothetical protein
MIAMNTDYRAANEPFRVPFHQFHTCETFFFPCRIKTLIATERKGVVGQDLSALEQHRRG